MPFNMMGRVNARPVVVGLALALLAILALSGCTKAEPVEASVWAMPDVVWDGGATPSGGAEDSPWAKEFRTNQLLTAYVWATVDTSYPEFVKQFGYDEAVNLGERFGDGTGNLHYYDSTTGEYQADAPATWDAQRLLVTRVTVDPGGDSAVIEYSFVKYSQHFDESVKSTIGGLTHNDDGTISLDGVLLSELPDGFEFAEDPPIEDIPTARWATPITKPTLGGEVKMPLPRDYYVKLGVISE